jgi:tryptophan-rich sensory protein
MVKHLLTGAKKGLWPFVAAIIGCELIGIGGSFFTINEIPTWYETLVRPSFQPPNWLFGPVWTVLYALLGIALVYVWRSFKTGSVLRKIFTLQLALNAIWTPIFFGLHNLAVALIVILTMDILTVALIYRLWKPLRSAAWCLIPYCAWILFATALNAAILILNR